MKVYARHTLIDASLAPEEPALLLEGSWPAAGQANAKRWSLDDVIDARFAWIDVEASHLAEAAAGRIAEAEVPALEYDLGMVAYLNALRLRYFLVKLLRIVAFLANVARPASGDRHQLHLAEGDDDYRWLYDALCQTHELTAQVECRPRPMRDDSQTNDVGRRRSVDWRSAAASLLNRRHGQNGRARVAGNKLAVFCGNRHLLGGVCDQWLGRGHSACWLYDRFALKSWLRWAGRGVEQLVCDSQQGAKQCLSPFGDLPRLTCHGVDLTAAVRQWLLATARTRGQSQVMALERIDCHFARVRPRALILDEDATPFARAAVLAARRHGARSLVVQHGVPCVRFGFAPLAADRILCLGESSRAQLAGWGVPDERIDIAGCPAIAPRARAPQRSSRRRLRRAGPRVLLLANVPPRSTRPDAVSFHLTDATHRVMLQMACASVESINQAILIVKLHPRDSDRTALLDVLSRRPTLRWRVTRAQKLPSLFRNVDCVLSCASTAGIEAAHAGVPVIQLLPAGSADLLPAAEWGLLGTARTAAELRELLPRALQRAATHLTTAPSVFASVGGTAAARIADLMEANVDAHVGGLRSSARAACAVQLAAG